MVFINPVGGPGKGVTLFNRHVRPMFEMAEIKFTVTVTGKLCVCVCVFVCVCTCVCGQWECGMCEIGCALHHRSNQPCS